MLGFGLAHALPLARGATRVRSACSSVAPYARAAWGVDDARKAGGRGRDGGGWERDRDAPRGAGGPARRAPPPSVRASSRGRGAWDLDAAPRGDPERQGGGRQWEGRGARSPASGRGRDASFHQQRHRRGGRPATDAGRRDRGMERTRDLRHDEELSDEEFETGYIQKEKSQYGRGNDRGEEREMDRGYGRGRDRARDDDFGIGRGGFDRGGEQWDRSARGRDEEPSELQRVRDTELDLLYGIAPILAALKSARRNPRTLYVQERRGEASAGPARKASHDVALSQIHYLADVLKIPVKTLPKGDLNVLARDRPHQGFVLHATPLEYEDVSDIGPPPKGSAAEVHSVGTDDGDAEGAPVVASGAVKAAPVWLVLDEVSDPQNLGALLRSAHFLGASGVVACRRNSAALTPVVSKASAGALESMTVHGVASMPRFLRRAKEQGWRIVGAAVADNAVTVGGLAGGVPTLIVLGSEGRGLRPMVRESCDVLVRIGSSGPRDDAVDSLNVSVAGAIVLHRLLGG